MAFADLTPDKRDDRVWDTLQQLLGSNLSQRDDVMRCTAVQAVIGGRCCGHRADGRAAPATVRHELALAAVWQHAALLVPAETMAAPRVAQEGIKATPLRNVAERGSFTHAGQFNVVRRFRANTHCILERW